MNHVEVEEGDKKRFAGSNAAARTAQAGSAGAELRDRPGPASGRARRRAGGPHGTHGGAGMGQGDEAIDRNAMEARAAACANLHRGLGQRVLPGIEGVAFADAGLARNPGQDLWCLHDENSFQIPGEAASQ